MISSSQLRSAASGAAAAISPAAIAAVDSGFCTVTMWRTASGWVAASSAAASTAFDAPSDPSVPTTIELNIAASAASAVARRYPRAVRERRSARISASR